MGGRERKSCSANVFVRRNPEYRTYVRKRETCEEPIEPGESVEAGIRKMKERGAL